MERVVDRGGGFEIADLKLRRREDGERKVEEGWGSEIAD